MFEASAIFFLPFVTLLLFTALGVVDLQRTKAAIRAENRSIRRR